MRFAGIDALGRALQRSSPEAATDPGVGASFFEPTGALQHSFLFAADDRDLQQQTGILTPDLVLFCCADAEITAHFGRLAESLLSCQRGVVPELLQDAEVEQIVLDGHRTAAP